MPSQGSQVLMAAYKPDTLLDTLMELKGEEAGLKCHLSGSVRILGEDTYGYLFHSP